jgi:hypothetical protein
MAKSNPEMQPTMPNTAKMLVLIGLLAVCAPGCRGEEEADFYSIDAPAIRLAEGATGSIEVGFKARPGYKWNSEFPARLDVMDTGNLAVEKREFTSTGKDFKDQDGTGLLSIPFDSGPLGKSTVKARAAFSVCNASECRIFRDIPIEVEVHVQ